MNILQRTSVGPQGTKGGGVSFLHRPSDDVCLRLMDLPDEVLTAVATSLRSLRDVLALAATNTRMHRVCRDAPLLLETLVEGETVSSSSSARGERRCSRKQLKDMPFEESRCLTMKALNSLCHSFKRTRELNLSCLSISDEDVAKVMEALPELCSLGLSTCTKLTNETVKILIYSNRLRAVDLRRCYGLDAHLASYLFAKLAEGEGRSLTVLTLSHLDLFSHALSTRRPIFGPETQLKQGLKVLALLNCPKVSRQSFHAVVAACPNLEMLCLGGSSMFFDFDGHGSSIMALRERINTGLVVREPIEGQGRDLSAVIAAANQEPMTHEECRLLVELDYRLRQRVEEATKFMNSKGVGISSYKHWIQNMAVEIALAVFHLPFLRVLEVSFCAQRLPEVLNKLLSEDIISLGRRVMIRNIFSKTQSPDLAFKFSSSNQDQQGSAGNSFAVHASSRSLPSFSVWNVCDVETISQMLLFRTLGSRELGIDQSDVDLVLRAVSSGRWSYQATALHHAAEEGNVFKVDSLIQFGADPCALDRSGTTPLFSACEAGHLEVALKLLQAGAKVLGRNAAHENSLYIAALRGHEKVLNALIHHCHDVGIDWTDPVHYGDGWTPIHAAAVSGRTSIASQLILEAGNRASTMIRAKNRYGQTSLHVAARKGSPELIRLLVSHADAETLSMVDADGRTAADVARRNGNSGAWMVLTGKNEEKFLSRGGMSSHISSAEQVPTRYLLDLSPTKVSTLGKVNALSEARRGRFLHREMLDRRERFVHRDANRVSGEGEKKRWIGRRLRQRQQQHLQF